MSHKDFGEPRSLSASPCDIAIKSSTRSRNTSVNHVAHHYKQLLALCLLSIATILSCIVFTGSHWRSHSTSEVAQDPLLTGLKQQQVQISLVSSNQAHTLQLLQRLVASQSNELNSGTNPGKSLNEESSKSAMVAALPQLTRLHNSALRSGQGFEHHRAVARGLLDKLVHMQAVAAQQEVDRQLQQPGIEPLYQFVYQLYRLLLGSGRLFPCREDITLVPGDVLHKWSKSSSSRGSRGATSPGDQIGSNGNRGSSNVSSSSNSGDVTGVGAGNRNMAGGDSGNPKYYFATNMFNTAQLMPQFTLSLLQTVLRLPKDDVYVSVYESNSDDSVHGWMDVLQLALNIIGTPSRIVSRGILVRDKGQDRIKYLAQLRNTALVPLYNHYASSSMSTSSSTPAKDGSSGNSRRPAAPGDLPWDPDYVVFINDVYFCWSMVLRLMGYRADITCGMDFGQANKDEIKALPADQRVKGHHPKPVIPSEYMLEAPLPLEVASIPDQTAPLAFYDTWVARDVAGSRFSGTYPYIVDKVSGAYVKQGLPVRASCCWNGLSILAAEPFKRGIRFRSHIDKRSSGGKECRASECSLLCNDFARLGFDRVVVDAGVQVAYKWDLAREMMAAGVEGIAQSTWAQVKAAGVAEATRQPAYDTMECCDLEPGGHYVVFDRDCRREDVMSVNYTAEALSMSSSW